MSPDRRREQNLSQNSLLSRDAIREHMHAGNIIIDPFVPENLGTVSYDVSLGRHYFREQNLGPLKKIYSPWSESDVKAVWGKPQLSESAEQLFGEEGMAVPEGILPSDKVILIKPGETILVNTEEFIGGRNCITTSMHARSTTGRNFLEVCKCAGWGDVGYITRWTMEVTNNSMHFTIPLVSGRRIAQIAFHQVDPFLGNDYTSAGKYQVDTDLDTIKKEWLPHMMLPKMWKDREVEK